MGVTDINSCTEGNQSSPMHLIAHAVSGERDYRGRI